MKSESQPPLEVEDSALPVTSDENPPAARRPFGTFRVLGNRDYALLFWGQFISATGTQMQVVAVAWQVYLLTHSALALGLIGLMQALPRLLFSLVGGVLADALDRRKVLIIVNVVMMLFSAILALCTNFQVVNLLIIFVLILLSAAASSFEFPARQYTRLSRNVVPPVSGCCGIHRTLWVVSTFPAALPRVLGITPGS